MINNKDVISQGIIGPGSMIVINGRPLTVSSVNAENCGVICLTVTKDYTGMSGLKFYAGLDPHHYKYSITYVLIPGVAYFV